MYSTDQFLRYLNLAREYPSHYIPLIDKQISLFVTDRQMSLTDGVLYQTNQGKNVWRQAKNFLMTQKSLPPFVKHPGLCKAATDHKNDLCLNNIFGHQGTDGSSFSQRILRHCKKSAGAMAEIIGADFDIANRNTAQMTILSLIIDDGVRDRGHRNTIFNPNYRYVGWSSGKQDQKIITIFNLSQNNLQTFYGGNQNQNSFCGINKGSTTPRNYSIRPLNGIQPIKDISNNFTSSQPQWKGNNFGVSPSSSFNNNFNSNSCDLSKLGHKKGKKIAEKRENTRTFYEQGAKIMQITTKFIYVDGSVQQNVDRRTIYLDE